MEKFGAYIPFAKDEAHPQVERHLEIITVCVPFRILCKYFTINKRTSQSKGVCWNPTEVFEQPRERAGMC